MLTDVDYLGTKTDKKEQQLYYCKRCDYTTSHNGHWKRHIKTKKHNADCMLTDVDYLGTKTDKKGTTKWQCICGKHYSYKQSYYRHKKTCIYKSTTEAEPQNQIVAQGVDKDALILDLLKRIEEKDKMMSDLIHRVGNNNMANSHNTNIILQLNTQYPDAQPIQYLIDQIKSNSKCVTHDPKLYAKAFIDALSHQTDDEKTIRAIKDTMYIKYEKTGFGEDKEAQVFDTIKKETEQDQLAKANKQNSNMLQNEKESTQYPEMVYGITKPLTSKDKKQLKKEVIKIVGNDSIA